MSHVGEAALGRSYETAIPLDDDSDASSHTLSLPGTPTSELHTYQFDRTQNEYESSFIDDDSVFEVDDSDSYHTVPSSNDDEDDIDSHLDPCTQLITRAEQLRPCESTAD